MTLEERAKEIVRAFIAHGKDLLKLERAVCDAFYEIFAQSESRISWPSFDEWLRSQTKLIPQAEQCVEWPSEDSLEREFKSRMCLDNVWAVVDFLKAVTRIRSADDVRAEQNTTVNRLSRSLDDLIEHNKIIEAKAKVLEEALERISHFSGLTLLGDFAHAVGANKAFKQCAETASEALKKYRGDVG